MTNSSELAVEEENNNNNVVVVDNVVDKVVDNVVNNVVDNVVDDVVDNVVENIVDDNVVVDNVVDDDDVQKETNDDKESKDDVDKVTNDDEDKVGSRSSNKVLKPFKGEKPLLDPKVEQNGVEEMLKQLTLKEKDELTDEHMVLRYFRGESGNVKKALEKLRNTLAWRSSFGVEEIKSCCGKIDANSQETRQMLRREGETGKIYVRGYDKEGRAIMYMRPGRENTNMEENNMKSLVYHLERAVACTRSKSGLEKINIFIDYDGFKLSNAPPMSTSKYTLNILQNHYPERMYRSYLLNPPLIFRTFWAVIRPFIDKTTKEKIVFVHGKAGKELMEQNFNLKDIEVCAGGTIPNTEPETFPVDDYMNLELDEPML